MLWTPSGYPTVPLNSDPAQRWHQIPQDRPLPGPTADGSARAGALPVLLMVWPYQSGFQDPLLEFDESAGADHGTQGDPMIVGCHSGAARGKRCRGLPPWARRGGAPRTFPSTPRAQHLTDCVVTHLQALGTPSLGDC